ncbi:hypothetical protein [Burkholderia pseudomallei]|uniref:hypothetical protein n=1 Tax=Burkholderia pseudomallei TaxID=28450 RepID=UPI0006AD6E67|nr:hypothetical protein [Burkholderia pseudomallei]ALB92657.1 hypothetical protein AM256_02905 [Burkholderia pseudomallei]ALB98719.1 hypothetical protein AM257_02900 [Burkholderia pseudomallei]
MEMVFKRIMLHRAIMQDAVRQVVCDGVSPEAAVAGLGIPQEEQVAFAECLRKELMHLETFNCVRFRLEAPAVERWIEAGRPGL